MHDKPWRVETWDYPQTPPQKIPVIVDDNRNLRICAMDCDGGHPGNPYTYTFDEALANAKVMAAAKDLQKACRELLASLKNLKLKECYGEQFGNTRDVDCPCTCCTARAALRKSE